MTSSKVILYLKKKKPITLKNICLKSSDESFIKLGWNLQSRCNLIKRTLDIIGQNVQPCMAERFQQKSNFSLVLD